MEEVVRNSECMICGIEGKMEEGFICENCGGINRIILICTNCWNRIDLTEFPKDELKKLELLIEHPLEMGIIVVSTTCPKCRNEDAGIKIYRVKRITPVALFVATAG